MHGNLLSGWAAAAAAATAQATAQASAKTLLQWQSETKAGSFTGFVSEKIAAEDEAKRLQREKEEAMRKDKEEKTRKEAQSQNKVEKTRCHLHTKPKNGCKFCQRHTELVNEIKEEKAALREKFISDVRNAKKERKDPEIARGLEIANPATYGFPPLFQNHVVESTHFKMLMGIDSLDTIVDEIFRFAESVEPYMPNSATVPTPLFCCLYRLLTYGLNGHQLRRLLENEQSPYIRCAGFLFIRFGLPPDKLWPWLSEYILDEELLRPNKGLPVAITVGEYVESLLVQERYYNVVMPRCPVVMKRRLEEKLAQVPQYRKRSQANQRNLDAYREPGTDVEMCTEDGDWREGEVLELVDDKSSRLKVKVKLKGGVEEVVHIGKVILADSRSARGRGARERSRSRSPGGSGIDWSREKGRSTEELLEAVRRRDQDSAVCATGKEYTKRAVTVNFALPMAHGAATHRDYQDGSAPLPATKRRERSRSPLPKKSREHSAEYMAQQRAVFEKYGMAKSSGEAAKKNDIEGPDMFQLG